MNLFKTEDDGGSNILGYKLFADQGNDFTSPFTQITRYDGTSLQFTVTVGQDGLQVGKIYRFTSIAFNAYGDSSPSLEMIAGLGARPSAPAAPTRDSNLSEFQSMLIKWTQVTISDLPIYGYILQMDDGLNGDFAKAYDGSSNPMILESLVKGLTPARPYRFKVQAVDINGPG